MLVMHFSLTPLVGAPLRVSRALSLLDDIESRVVVLRPDIYDNLKFENDLTWESDKEEILALVEKADILHLHNYIDLHTNSFAPIDFKKLWLNGKPMVRQFHSTLELISRVSKASIEDIYNCPLPKLVIAQFQERFYPDAKVVPNVVFGNYIPQGRSGKSLRISYAPSNFRSARDFRWDTKGYPETIKMLKRFKKKALSKGLKVEIDIIEQVSHDECLRRKALSDIAIDDLVTGSYHMSTLESLMAGSAVLSYLDERVVNAVATITGRTDFPVINTRLEEAEQMLLYLCSNPKLTRELGNHSGRWMHEYWAPDRMATIFENAYIQVIENPKIKFENRFSLSGPIDLFINQAMYDVRWKARHEIWPKFFFAKPKAFIGSLLRKVGLKK
jgi:hypothetical protein